MNDDIKDRDNKDAEESGRPVQLDHEEQEDTMVEPGQEQPRPDQAGRVQQDC